MRDVILVLAAVTAVSLAVAPGWAANERQEVGSAIDGEWITITGRVTSRVGSELVVDYGAGDITVETDLHNWNEASAVFPGDRVIVTGRMDDDFYDRRTIEASSVYVDKLNTYLYADPADEEHVHHARPNATPAQDDEWLAMTGTVVSKETGTLTLDTGPRHMSVDTRNLGELSYVDAGDRVTVYGEMDDLDLFDGRELLATSVILLSPG